MTRLHEQYLKNEESFANIYARLSELEISLVNQAAQADLAQIVPVFEGLERSMSRFHDHQAETLRVHAAYLKSQEEFAKNFVRMAEQLQGNNSSPSFPISAAPAAQPPLTTPSVTSSPLPAPAPQRPLPVQASQVVQVTRTEEKPVAVQPTQAASGNGHNGASKSELPKPVTASAKKSASFDAETLTQALLNVVSEKTGYPAEMLELDTDMEADLGIDSIKRVEILGAMRNQFPTLPKADPEAFAEVRTLGQTVQYMMSSAGSELAAVQEESPSPATAPTSSASGSYSADELTAALLSVVSEKTGYPVEMLELDTDMEADLGIDSIKRVEILGAMRNLFPNLPKADPEAFAEVRTLGQTVQYMLNSAPQADLAVQEAGQTGTQITAAKAPTLLVVTESTASSLDTDAVSAALLRIVSEKTGYPVEMLELDTDMEADLGIDSIKRVEILGALRNEFPALPKADPEAFADVRTLGQIIDYLAAGEKKSENPDAVEPALILPVDTTIPRGIVQLQPLPHPDLLETALPSGHICLISDNGTAETSAIAEALLQHAWKVVVLSFPGSVVAPRLKLPAGVERVSLVDMSEEQLQVQLAQIQTQFGPVAAFIHLNPPFAGSNGEIYSSIEKQIIRHVFLLAKHLKDPLTLAARQGNACFVAVAHLDGKFGLGEGIEYSPVSGGLFGLVKTLNLEWEQVNCRAVDISPEIPLSQTRDLILAEVFDPNRRLIEVGYSSEGRHTLVVASTNGEQVME